MSKQIPDIVIGRLPIYLRTLQRIHQQGRKVTSSQELGEQLGISAAQIRKDLSQFGEFGKQGTGYEINFLIGQLKEILNVQGLWEVAVIGAGSMGIALSHYPGFKERGFIITQIYDNDKNKVGSRIGEFVVRDSASLIHEIKSAGIQVAMIATPAVDAQKVADELVKAGVKAILNYAPVHLIVPEDVRLQNIDPSIHLQRMTYYL